MTSREIDEAAARLATNARDPNVAQAIRRQLAQLYRQGDVLSGVAPPGTPPPAASTNPASLYKQITDELGTCRC